MQTLIRSVRLLIGLAIFSSLLFVTVHSATVAAAGRQGFLQIKDGYFWDPGVGSYFLPRGIAYQSWNPPVGASQSFEQLDYDLLEFKKIHANSVRCEFVWGEVQTGTNTWDWSKPDHLVEEAERLGLRLFVIIGFQYPPAWFPPEWRNINDQGLTLDVLDCVHRSAPGQATNCFPRPLYESLTTNSWSAALLPSIIDTLRKSATPAEVVTRLQTTIPQQDLQSVLRCFISDVVNFEHPQARLAYSNHIAKVAARYKDRAAIGAWIMGNECAYFDLWESPTVYSVHRFIGYDPLSIAAFKEYLKRLYNGRIEALNANWNTSYASFDSVEMPRFYPAARDNPAFHDLIQWRQRSIGGFVSLGAAAARREDPNHLLTYSMVGGIFNGNDANNTCEDAKSIVAACRDAGAPLAFWCINNYAWASYGSELRTGDFGISKYQETLGLPVMISETGHSSTENLFSGAKPRQAKALPGQIWESLMSGAIGTHLFHWSDRDQFTRGYFDREKGFGIVHQDRTPKEPVYSNVLEMFRRMEEIHFERLLGGSKNPPRDVLFYWSTAGESVWPRANQENAMLWGALKRLGYQPGIIDDTQFSERAYTNARVLLLSRAQQLTADNLEKIRTDVLSSGIHVHANADLPGQFDTYLKPNPNWQSAMRSIFGIDVSGAIAAYHSGATNDKTSELELKGVSQLGALGPGWNTTIKTWRIWHGIRAVEGKTILNHTGYLKALASKPTLALHTLSLPSAKTAINDFAVADVFEVEEGGAPKLWDVRYDILRAVYRDHFGIIPRIDVSGPGAKRIISDYRVCPNGSILFSILNEDTTRAPVIITSPLLVGKTIENLTTGGILTTRSSGTFGLNLSDDQYILFYAYDRTPAGDTSLINSNPAKVWFEGAPLAVWPSASGFNTQVAFDTGDRDLQLSVGLEQIQPVQRILSMSPPQPASGAGKLTLVAGVPDPDLNDPDYLSTPEGGVYQFRAVLMDKSQVVSATTLPMRLTWAVRPESLPPVDAPPGSLQSIPVIWQELPSADAGDSTPLDRTALWSSIPGSERFYNVILDLIDASGVIRLSLTNSTSRGTGRFVFTARMPENLQRPARWSASIQRAANTQSLDFVDGFEGRDRGLDRAPFHPWFSYSYSTLQDSVLKGQGVSEASRDGKLNKSAYLTVLNSSNSTAATGFGMVMGVEAVFDRAALASAAQVTGPSPREIALPASRELLVQYRFSFEFRETLGLPCELELQVRDVKGGIWNFVKTYVPGPGGWDTASASLAEFVQDPAHPGFDPAHVKDFVVNVRMLKAGAEYQGEFDNIRITGPVTFLDDFEDRFAMADYSKIAPWYAYGYDEPNHNDVRLDHGIQLKGSEGSQSLFLVAGNRPDSGNFSGFGIIYNFPQPWSLPADTGLWRNYTLSFDFRETNSLPCVLEIQLKNSNLTNAVGFVTQRLISYSEVYKPDASGWHRITANLGQFQQTGFSGTFDPTAIQSFVANVAMLEKDPARTVVYIGSFDNMLFDGPEQVFPGSDLLSRYDSANDFFGFKSFSLEASGELYLRWSGGGTLESSATPGAPWQVVPTAGSEHRVPASEATRFFRLKK